MQRFRVFLEMRVEVLSSVEIHFLTQFCASNAARQFELSDPQQKCTIKCAHAYILHTLSLVVVGIFIKIRSPQLTKIRAASTSFLEFLFNMHMHSSATVLNIYTDSSMHIMMGVSVQRRNDKSFTKVSIQNEHTKLKHSNFMFTKLELSLHVVRKDSFSCNQ